MNLSLDEFIINIFLCVRPWRKTDFFKEESYIQPVQKLMEEKIPDKIKTG